MDEIAVPKRVKERNFEKFAELGESAVRQQVLRGRYGGQRLEWAREWLSRFDAEREAEENSSREARMEASSAESLRIARSAKNAAWAAAIAGIIAIMFSIAMPFILSRLGIKP